MAKSWLLIFILSAMLAVCLSAAIEENTTVKEEEINESIERYMSILRAGLEREEQEGDDGYEGHDGNGDGGLGEGEMVGYGIIDGYKDHRRIYGGQGSDGDAALIYKYLASLGNFGDHSDNNRDRGFGKSWGGKGISKQSYWG